MHASAPALDGRGAVPLRVVRSYIWREPAGPAPPGSALARVQRGQVQVALGGVALWLAGLIPGILPWPGVVWVALGAVVVVGVVTWLLMPPETLVLTATLVATAPVVLFATGAQEPGSPFAAIWWDAAAVSLIGCATLRRALVGVAVVGGVELVAWLVLVAIAEVEGGWRSAIAWAVATVALGVTAAGMAAIVRAGARRLDATVEAARRTIGAEELAAAERSNFDDTARLLHDTVINTLTAISRGGTRDRIALRNRCRHDLALLDRSLPQVDPVAAARERALALGLDLHVHGDVVALTTVALPVRQAVSGAVAEALLNVSKHAGVHRADLAVTTGAGNVVVTVADSGRGWDGGVPDGRGIDQSIMQRCADVGVEVRVTSIAGDGTTIALTVPVLGDGVENEEVFVAESRIMGAFVCAALLIDMAVRTLLTWGLLPVTGSVVALALIVSVMTWPILLGAPVRRVGPWAPLGLALVLLPVTLLLPESTGAISWAWWGTVAAIAVFLALVSVRRSVWWIGLAFLAQVLGRFLVAGEDLGSLLPDVVVTGLGALIAVWIRRRVLTMLHETAAVATETDRIRRDLLRETSSHQASLGGLRRATGFARAPLEAIASGVYTGAETGLRAESGRLAVYLRNVARVGPELGGVGAGLLLVLDAARAREASAALTVDPRVPLPDQAAEDAVAGFLAAVAGAVRPGDRLALTLLGRPGGGAVTVLAPDSHPLVAPPGLHVVRTPGDGQVLTELSWRIPAPAADRA